MPDDLLPRPLLATLEPLLAALLERGWSRSSAEAAASLGSAVTGPASPSLTSNCVTRAAVSAAISPRSTPAASPAPFRAEPAHSQTPAEVAVSLASVVTTLASQSRTRSYAWALARTASSSRFQIDAVRAEPSIVGRVRSTPHAEPVVSTTFVRLTSSLKSRAYRVPRFLRGGPISTTGRCAWESTSATARPSATSPRLGSTF